MSRRSVILLSAAALAASVIAPVGWAGATVEDGLGGAPDVAVSETGSYIVVMEGDPLVVTEGREDVDTPRARNRGQQMKAEHDRALRGVGADPAAKTNDYTVALNGFSAVISHEDAEQLAARKDVKLVMPDELQQKQTDSSPEFLGLSGPGGAYENGLTGEGVVVGVIDTGIWPEHPSFADDGSYAAPPTDDLPCEFGNTAHHPEDAPFDCNNKLIGARQMLSTYRAIVGADDDEFDSARDDDGHGTHTASTAAGNAGVEATVGVHDLGEVSGIAHRAHVVAYKGLGKLGGFTSDLAAAIDQAVADGVDVINYSIGGGAGLTGADEIAFLFAADAGVHVATSAGNSGPGAATVGGPGSAPWLTTVGASTQPRFFQGTVHLGNGASYTGASLTDGVGESPLVDAADATEDGDDLCRLGTLDPEVVEGAIVLCKRGAIARVEKSQAVLEAGGVGMIMYEQSDEGDRFTDNHFVPTVHVDNTPGIAIKDYIADAAEPTASITTGEIAEIDFAPSMTSFSSRGPDPVAEDIIKPDVTAPGMQILAGASPVTYAGTQGNLFQSIAGTSMSSPHVAGLLALIDQANPDWSPAMAKSALMTTADPDVRDNDRVSPADPFDMGSGHVNPGRLARNKSSIFRPGLVYDAGFLDYYGFLCDMAPEIVSANTCAALPSIGVPTVASDLNYPSIGVAELAGSRTVTRTVTSTTPGRQRYTASVDAPDGYTVTVDPASFTIQEGQSQTFTITIENVDAPIGEWRFGSLTWMDRSGRLSARSPIAVKGALFAAPSEINGSGEDGTASFDVQFGYTGEYTAAPHGLVPATVTKDNVVQDPDQNFDPEDGYSNVHTFDLVDVAHFRLEMPPEATEPDADLDIFVYDPNGDQVASSTSGGTDEEINISNPANGTWTVYVHGWQAPDGDSDYDMFTWSVPAAPGGSLSIDSAPPSATIGDTGIIDVSWTGATAGEWHLGAVSHNRGSDRLGLTLVEVDNR